MPKEQRLRLDNPVFDGRLRRESRTAGYIRRPIEDVKLEYASRRQPSAAPTQQKRDLVKQSPSPKPSVPGSRRPTAPSGTIAIPAGSLHHSKDQVLKQPTVEPSKRASGSKAPFRQRALTIMAVLVFMFGIAASLHSFKTDKDVQAQVADLSEPQLDSDSGSSVPDETDIPEDVVSNYHVAPDLPRHISIQKSGVYARIQRMGIKANNELTVPHNTQDAGWYDGSSKPGENGAMLIIGHVSGLTKPGVFHNLKNLAHGDMINIERGDGKKINYKVVKTEVYDKNKVDMTKALVSIEPGKKGLNLITCDGRYDAKTETYDKRMMVFAVQE